MAGIVYPERTKNKDFLACYAELFPTVELNFSYAKSLTMELGDFNLH